MTLENEYNFIKCAMEVFFPTYDGPESTNRIYVLTSLFVTFMVTYVTTIGYGDCGNIVQTVALAVQPIA